MMNWAEDDMRVTDEALRHVLRVAKALSDPSRLRALAALREGELCVCQLIALLNLAPSTVSKHLSILHEADLVESRKEGRWVHYRLPRTFSSACAQHVARQTAQALAGCATIVADSERLKDMENTALEELCRQRTQKKN
jgi:ArsR family transcriptional regulator, arsenate/arsenite/antimonite-responsive transcriptional repressor